MAKAQPTAAETPRSVPHDSPRGALAVSRQSIKAARDAAIRCVHRSELIQEDAGKALPAVKRMCRNRPGSGKAEVEKVRSQVAQWLGELADVRESASAAMPWEVLEAIEECTANPRRPKLRGVEVDGQEYATAHEAAIAMAIGILNLAREAARGSQAFYGLDPLPEFENLLGDPRQPASAERVREAWLSCEGMHPGFWAHVLDGLRQSPWTDCNDVMKSKVMQDPDARGWTVTQWQLAIQYGRATIQGTEMWKSLHASHVVAKIRRREIDQDRRRGHGKRAADGGTVDYRKIDEGLD